MLQYEGWASIMCALSKESIKACTVRRMEEGVCGGAVPLTPGIE